mmetsp:Transcript_7185/g.10685  ORF Transcript_7185/g.10685 Transcript_7185/m.10685 type:complete len:296 (-) Transcript_7185:74-961(-)
MSSELHDAVRDKDIESAKQCIANGANLDAVDSMSRTALHLACWKGDPDMVKLLLRSKASPTVRARDNFTPLHFAVQSGSIECCKILLEHEKKLLTMRISKGNKSALHLAAAKNNLELVRFLLDEGADPSSLTNKRQTALDFARDKAVFALIKQRIESKITGDSLMLQKKASSKPSSQEDSICGQKRRADNSINMKSKPSTSDREQITDVASPKLSVPQSSEGSDSTLPLDLHEGEIGPFLPTKGNIPLPTDKNDATEEVASNNTNIVKIDLSKRPKKKQKIGIQLAHLHNDDDIE